MTTKEARQLFDAVAADTTDANARAGIELAREYFTNPTFRKALEQHVWDLNQAAGR